MHQKLLPHVKKRKTMRNKLGDLHTKIAASFLIISEKDKMMRKRRRRRKIVIRMFQQGDILVSE